jgi:hypothetical protein
MTVRHSEPKPGALPVSTALRERLRAFVSSAGERDAASTLQLNRQTLARALAGLALHRGTVTHLEQRLSAVEAGDAA